MASCGEWRCSEILKDLDDYYYWAKRHPESMGIFSFHLVRETFADKEATCYDEESCFYCVGHKHNRPLQEICDIEREYDEIWFSNREQEKFRQKVFLNWKNGLDAWENPILLNIKHGKH